MTKSRGILIGVLLGFTTLIAGIHYMSSGIFEAGDGVSHFQHARYCWETPRLFLSHWGKPLFTLLSSPFAQLGYEGYLMFSLLAALFTGYLVHEVLRKLECSLPWLGTLVLFCTPVYTKNVLGGMTEVLFGLGLILSLYWVLFKKNNWAAVLVSFLPFVRPEAYVLFPIYGLFFLFKNVRSIPLLLLGNLVYGLVGLIALDDFLWAYSQDPYMHKEIGVYGFGEWGHFLKGSKNIAGIPISILFALSTLLSFWYLKREKNQQIQPALIWGLFILTPVIAVFAVHSYLWVKGLNGSLGLLRVLATIMPLVALSVALMIGRFYEKVRVRIVGKGIVLVLSLLCIVTLIDRLILVKDVTRKEKCVFDSATWVKENYDGKGTVHYLDPLIAFSLDLNPFGGTGAKKIYHLDKEHPSSSMKSGDLLVWEAHYASNEGRLPKANFINDSSLTVLKTIRPDPAVTIFGRDYEVLIVKKN